MEILVRPAKKTATNVLALKNVTIVMGVTLKHTTVHVTSTLFAWQANTTMVAFVSIAWTPTAFHAMETVPATRASRNST